MIGPIQAADILVGDDIVENDWHLRVTQAWQGQWKDATGAEHFGEIVITRQLGPEYPQHFALTQVVQVERTAGPVTPW